MKLNPEDVEGLQLLFWLGVVSVLTFYLACSMLLAGKILVSLLYYSMSVLNAFYAIKMKRRVILP